MTALRKEHSLTHRKPALKFVPPTLEQGEHLDRKTFHERYEAMPEHVHAELINGIVHMPSPLKISHSHGQLDLVRILFGYQEATNGVDLHDNATVILGPDDEPQPDLTLIICPKNGGNTREMDDYIYGAPELVIEVAVSSASIDLHEKKLAYARCGVREFLVHAVRDEQVYWFANRGGKFEPLDAKNGLFRSEIFPGLWLDSKALVRSDRKKLLAVLNKGLATPEHRAFVKQLAKSARIS